MKLFKKAKTMAFPVILLGFSLFFLIYEILRAVQVDITYDEATTYLNYLTGDPLHVLNFVSTNNHFLNTLLARIFCFVGGNAEWVLRLPSLLGYVLYLVFSFLIVNKLSNKIIATAGFLLLNVNPYVMDFFGLCRGYGLSLGLLMAALFFYVSFLEHISGQKQEGYRNLSWSLGLAACSVLANLALLNVYAVLVFMTLVFFVVLNRKNPSLGDIPSAGRKRSPLRKILGAVLVLFILFFNLILIAQDFIFSEKFTEPLTVRISGSGFSEEDRQASVVSGVSLFHGDLHFDYQNGLWTFNRASYLASVKFLVPPSALDNIEAIEFRIGREQFQYAPQTIRKWVKARIKKYDVLFSDESASLRRSLFPPLKNVINWGGDRPFSLSILRRAVLVFGLFAGLTLLVFFLGRLLNRMKILTREQFQPLVTMTLMLVALQAYPIFLFKKNQIFFGGETGFIQDTVLTLIRSSFYGKSYFPGQESSVLILILISFLFSSFILAVHYRKKTPEKIRPGFFFMGVLLLSAFSTVVQKILFHSFYLFERTALFFIPTYVLFLIFLFGLLGEGRPNIKIPAVGFFLGLTFLSAFHFSQTANNHSTRDWKFDADSKQMLEYVRNLKDKDAAVFPTVRLGVHWSVLPSISFYRLQKNMTWLEIDLVNKQGQYRNFDYCYLPPDPALEHFLRNNSQISVAKRYRTSGNLLLKTLIKPSPGSP
jgi:hypothetical protein